MLDSSIHTIELHTNLTNDSYKNIFNTLKNLNPSIEKCISTVYNKQYKITQYIFRKLPTNGITKIRLQQINDLTLDYIIKFDLYITINLYKTLYTNNTMNVQIIPPKKIISAIYLILDKLTSILGKNITNTLTLNRTDFCTNIKFPTETHAEEYILILRKGIPCKSLSTITHWDSKQHRYVAYKDTLLLQCKSYSFQIYSKYLQMQSMNLSGSEYAIGTVRFELRANKSKMEQLAKKYKITSPSEDYIEFLCLAPIISEYEIKRIVSNMVGSFGFYSYQYVKEQIMSSDYKESTKNKMLSIINYFSNHHANQNLLNDLDINHKDWSRILKKFNSLECSPITIPMSYQHNNYPGVFDWDQ